MNIMKKPSIFISHIHEEAEIASRLKSILDRFFNEMVTVFVSTEPKCLPSGKEFFPLIRSKIDECSLLIALCSPQSNHRPWIVSETSYAIGKQKCVVPICHGGLEYGQLTPFLVHINAVSTEAIDSFKSLEATIEEEIDCKLNNVIDWKPFVEVVERHHECVDVTQVRENEKPLVGDFGIVNLEQMRDREKVALIEIANSRTDCDLSLYDIISRMEHRGFDCAESRMAVQYLKRNGVVEVTIENDGYSGDYPACRITEDGWKIVEMIYDFENVESIKSKVMPFAKSGGFDDMPF